MNFDESVSRVVKQAERILDFEGDEVYVLLAIARKKNNPAISWKGNDYHKGPAVFRAVVREDNYESVIRRVMSMVYNYRHGPVRPEDFNLYLTVNPRSTRVAFHTLQGFVADWTLAEDWERLKHLESKWYSALQKRRSRSRKRYYIIDMDDHEDLAAADELYQAVAIKHDNLSVRKLFLSRNGVHVVAEPFNTKAFMDAARERGLAVEVKTDDCVNLWCGSWWADFEPHPVEAFERKPRG